MGRRELTEKADCTKVSKKLYKCCAEEACSLMIISSASVRVIISETLTSFPPSNLSHSSSCDTISSAALTFTYESGLARTIHVALVLFEECCPLTWKVRVQTSPFGSSKELKSF